MAIEWGPWQGSGNEMRVGIDVSWESVSHGEGAATATVRYYTENRWSWNDNQSLNLGGAIGGSINFQNNQSQGGPHHRGTKTYTYNYGPNQYGSSPGSRKFSATLSGAFNGITPSKTVTSSIPPRPIAAALVPTDFSVSRINDESHRLTWTNRSSPDRPWESITIQRDTGDNGTWSTEGVVGGGSHAFTDLTAHDREYRWRVRANNSAGASIWHYSEVHYTTPSVPTSVQRSDAAGPSQSITWSNNDPGYTEYETEIWASKNGAAWVKLGDVASGIASYSHTTGHATHPYTTGDSWSYRVRSKTTVGPTLYSAYSVATGETPGSTSPPLVPTGLSPNGVTVDSSLAIRLSWTFVPGHLSDTQTKFTVRHRRTGTTEWVTVTQTSANQFYDIPAGLYAAGDNGEWTVEVYGADPSPSPETAPSTFQAAPAAIPPDRRYLPALVDLLTGDIVGTVDGQMRAVHLTATDDVNTASGNKPALRLGDEAAHHVRMDGNEIQAMTDDTTPGRWLINAGGGAVTMGLADGSELLIRNQTVRMVNIPTGSFSANMSYDAATGSIRVNTSSSRFKEGIQAAQIDVDKALSLEPRIFQRNEDPSGAWHIGFIAEEAADAGLEQWVVRDDDGAPWSFAYDYWVVALQEVVRSQRDRLDTLEARLAILEGQ